MTIHYTVTYADSGIPDYEDEGASLSIDLLAFNSQLVGVHLHERINYITIIYQTADSDPFVLTCIPPSTVTPVIDKVNAITTINVPSSAPMIVVQTLATSWKQTSGPTFNIEFSEIGSLEGSVTMDFNSGTTAPPLKLKVVVKREP